MKIPAEPMAAAFAEAWRSPVQTAGELCGLALVSLRRFCPGSLSDRDRDRSGCLQRARARRCPIDAVLDAARHPRCQNCATTPATRSHRYAFGQWSGRFAFTVALARHSLRRVSPPGRPLLIDPRAGFSNGRRRLSVIILTDGDNLEITASGLFGTQSKAALGQPQPPDHDQHSQQQ
jgi:hypothetical protein